MVQSDSEDERTAAVCPPLAILDWGIGGLGFFKLLRSRRPDIAITYFSDSGEVPYGKLSKHQLTSRLHRILEFLHPRGVTHLVVACNAMSTILPIHQKGTKRSPVLITGVIEPTIDALNSDPHTRYGIVGGRRTILSGVYRKQLQRNGKSAFQRIAQPISRFIEDGQTDTESFASTLRKIVEPLRHSDALILGCTHYSAAMDQFFRLLPDATIIDPAELTLAWVEQNWVLPISGQRKDIFFTTGLVPEMRRAAQKAFGVILGDIQKIDAKLDTYRAGG